MTSRRAHLAVLAVAAALLLVPGSASLASGPNVQAGSLRSACTSSLAEAELTALGLPSRVPSLRGDTLVPLDVIQIIDDSGSMFPSTGGHGNDPKEQRVAAAATLTDFLSRWAVVAAPARTAVVHFGSTAPTEQASNLVALPDKNSSLAPYLRTVQNLKDTDFPVALERAREILSDAHSTDADIVVFTDGVPDVGDGRPVGLLFEDVRRALHRLPAGTRVHLFVFGGDDVWASSSRRWSDVGVASVTRVMSVATLADDYLAVLRPRLAIERVASGPLGASRTFEVDVPPLTDALFATVAGEGVLAVTLIGPERGPTARQAVGYTVRLAAVGHPLPGNWQIRVEGTGPATVSVDRLPVFIDAREASAGPRVGPKLVFVADVRNAAGYRPRNPISGLPGRLPAQIVLPDGRVQELSFKTVTTGVWKAAITATAPGAYTVRLNPVVGARLIGPADIQSSVASPDGRVMLTYPTRTRAGQRIAVASVTPDHRRVTLVLADHLGTPLTEISVSSRGVFSERTKPGCPYLVGVRAQGSHAVAFAPDPILVTRGSGGLSSALAALAVVGTLCAAATFAFLRRRRAASSLLDPV